MGQSILAAMLMANLKASACSDGRIMKSTKECGSMVKNMDLECGQVQEETPTLVSGSLA